MELLPLGPVLFLDTAGVDDVGALGDLRVKKTRRVFDRTDLGVVVTDDQWGDFERGIVAELRGRGIPLVVALNKADLRAPSAAVLQCLHDEGLPTVSTAAHNGEGMADLRQALLDAAPASFLDTPPLLRDLVGPGELALLVIPLDKEAPKGRLILPQVQTLRDLLEGDAYAMVVKDPELRDALGLLNCPPKLVVTDSQAFREVAATTPPEVPLTSFSILFARLKGDLVVQTEGALALDALRPGDAVLVAEACTHHPLDEDIGRVKIPQWLTQYVGGELQFTTVQGHDFPEDLSPYRLVIHCGACMWNRREMLSRLWRCRQAGVPVTNYGLTIAYALGILERALAPFPEALNVYRAARAVPGAAPGGTEGS